MANLGIIDIGSNSIRLVLFETGSKGNFQIVNDIKESVRLEEGMLDNLNIAEPKMDQAIDVLKMFKNMCSANEVEEIIAFGTQATRMACNREVFLERVLAETGIKIQVLSGEEEAYFDYVAVVRSMNIDDCLIMDMGGGSTELVWCKNNELLHSISLPIGTINLTRKFKLDDSVTDEQLKALRKYLQQQLDRVPWLKEVTAATLVGIGGSIRNIGKIDRRRRNYPLEINHHYIMDKHDVKSLAHDLAATDLKGRKEVKGLAGDRADIIVAPAATFAYVLDYCCLDSLIVSGNGLREGYVFSHLWGDLSMQRNPLDFSLYNTLYNYRLNEHHAEHVFRLSNTLFNQLQPLHNMGRELKTVLKTAAFLHHSGLNIRFYNYHEHSFYMIVNCGLLGLTQRELLLSAYVAAAHNKDNLKVDWQHHSQVINREDVAVVHKMGLLIKIAEGLDRSMNGSTVDLQCSIVKDTVVVKTITNSNNSLEISEAMKSSAYFKKMFGKNLIIV